MAMLWFVPSRGECAAAQWREWCFASGIASGTAASFRLAMPLPERGTDISGGPDKYELSAGSGVVYAVWRGTLPVSGSELAFYADFSADKETPLPVSSSVFAGGSDGLRLPAEYRAFEFSGLSSAPLAACFYLAGPQKNDAVYARGRAARSFGGEYFKRGDFPEAEREFALALKSEPGSAEILLMLGQIYKETGRCEQALVFFGKALSLCGEKDMITRAWTHNFMGICYDLTGKRELALGQYKQAASLGASYGGSLEFANTYIARPYGAASGGGEQ